MVQRGVVDMLSLRMGGSGVLQADFPHRRALANMTGEALKGNATATTSESPAASTFHYRALHDTAMGPHDAFYTAAHQGSGVCGNAREGLSLMLLFSPVLRLVRGPGVSVSWCVPIRLVNLASVCVHPPSRSTPPPPTGAGTWSRTSL
jgi:hypothetical protein